jgi:hypothetical protein
MLKNTTHQKHMDGAKAVIRRKFIAANAYNKKEARCSGTQL